MRRTSTRNYRQWGYIGFNGGGSDTSRVPHGEPYAGNLHVRFDEGAGVPDNKGRPALLYTLLYKNERVVAVTNLEGQVMAREYLVGDFVASETRFDGTTVQYGYDADGNLASISYPGETLSFSYDGDGLMLSASNSVGVVSNEYDDATGWLTASHGADGTEVAYSRRNGGSVASITSAAGTTSYAFDAAGRKTHVASPSGSFALGYCEWNGKLAAVTNAGWFVVEYEYDVMDRATNISWKTTSGESLGGFAYEYDAVGRIVSRSHAIGSNAFDRAYAYDDLDRLVSDGGVTYTYDAAGNRTTRTENGSTVTYTLGVGDRLASWTGGSYTYDFAGNVTRIERDGRPTLELAWNSQYQLVSVATNGVFAEGYEYDALGRRVSTTTLEGTTRHVYDDGWQVIADLDANGDVVASYVWGDGIDNLLAVNVGGATYYPLTDIQGTIWGYVDSQNNVVARWRYDAGGNVVDEEVSVPALANIRYRFQGREWSAATGLTNFRMRWYDAETGRWLSKDPIGLSGGLNLYSFCRNCAMCWRDEYGLHGESDNGYWDRYFEITDNLMLNPAVVILGVPMAPVPKRWAPSTRGRPPACGSDNEWTSLPRAFGFGHGKNNPHRPLARSPGFRNSSAGAGVALWGVGVWNFGVAVGALIGAAL